MIGIKCVQDRDTKNGSVWTSDSLGVTFDYSGDTLSITPTEGAKQNGGNTQNNNGNNINNNYPSLELILIMVQILLIIL